MSEKILIIDDEQDIADLLEVYLKNENYVVYKFYCATDAMSCIESGDIDLAILDIMLPDMDGFEVCRNIRATNKQIGIIMLIGLVAKNGILIVEFANQKQEAGIDKLHAIEEASLQRLRPILMTSASTILGLSLIHI